MTEQVTAAMVRSHEAMLREQASYDYEKVFWGSLFGVGLIGMGWITIKLGRIIQAVQDPVSAIPNREYDEIFDWVEGGNRNTPLPWKYPWSKSWIFVQVEIFRNNPDQWEAFKKDYVEVKENAPPEFKALELFDSFYGRYGAVMPAALLGFNMCKEAIRVRRLKE